MPSRVELREALDNNDRALKEVENQVVGSGTGALTFIFLNMLFSFRYPGWAQGVCLFMVLCLVIAMFVQFDDFRRLKNRRRELQAQYREAPY